MASLFPTKHCKTCNRYVGKFDPHPSPGRKQHFYCKMSRLIMFITTSWVHAGICYLTLSSKTCMFVFLSWIISIKKMSQIQLTETGKKYFCSLTRTWQQCILHWVFFILITTIWSSTLPHNDYVLFFKRNSYTSILSCT